MSNWTTDGARVTDEQVVQRLRSVMEGESDLIIEHRFYNGSRSPHRFVCADFATLERYGAY